MKDADQPSDLGKETCRSINESIYLPPNWIAFGGEKSKIERFFAQKTTEKLDFSSASTCTAIMYSNTKGPKYV
jgi:hypothetical protein